MENVVSIIKSRENELEFDISIQGVDDEGTQVRFVLETTPASLVFQCEHKEDDKWIVKIPPCDHIEAMTYQFHIEIVVGGYFFTPFKGTINVTNEPEVKSSGVGAPVVAPVVKATIKVNGESSETEAEEEKEEEAEEKEVEAVVKAEVEEEAEEEEKEEKEEDAKPIPDEYADLADSLIKNHKKKKAKETEQGKKVKEVLKDLEKEKKEKKDDEPEEKKEKEEKPKKKAAKKKAAPKKKKKEEKVEESSPFSFGESRTSTLSSVIDDFKKPAEVDKQAQKVQDILKNLNS